jgi:hypothetical protein
MSRPSAALGRRLVCLAAAVAAGSVAGCGTGSASAQAGRAAESLYAAVARQDGRTACAQLSPDTRAQLVKDEGERCERAVLSLRLRGRRAATVRVYATAAQVVLARGDTVFLGDGRQGWRVEAFGCRPAASGPFDCEAEA